MIEEIPERLKQAEAVETPQKEEIKPDELMPPPEPKIKASKKKEADEPVSTKVNLYRK